jgi:ribosomal protein L14E/L6E/L27E
MKAIETFKYCVDGNNITEIKEGEEVPEIAQAYALKNGYSEKSESAPENKAEKSQSEPENKAAKPELKNKSK